MAIKFEKIKPGMVLYDVRRATGWTRFKWNTWPVYIKEVNSEKREVLASWNSNKPEWMTEHRVTKYRAKMPKQEYK